MTDIPLPAQGSTDPAAQMAWYGEQEDLSDQVRGSYIPVTKFGVATGNTPAQNDTAFAAAVASGEPLLIPASADPYKISATIDMRYKQGAALVGFGNPAFCRIQQTANNTAIIRMGGGGWYRHQKLDGVWLEYATEQPATNTNSNAIELDRIFMAHLNRLGIYRSARAIHSITTDDGGGVMKSYVFSCHLSNIFINNYTHTALSLESTLNTSSTGNLVENIYTMSRTDGGGINTVERAISYYQHDATIIKNFNVELASFTKEAVLIANTKNCVIDALHYEEARQTVSGMGFVAVSGNETHLSLRAMDVHRSYYDATASIAPIFKVGDSVELDVYGLHTWGGTRNAASVPLFYTTDAVTGSVSLRGYESHDSAVTVEQSGFPAARVPVVKRVNESMRHWQEGAADVVLGTAAPTTGTWTRGSRVINTAPAASGFAGWICVTAGTPGTWKTFGAISA